MRKEVSILAFPVRLPTKRNYKALSPAVKSQALFMRFLLQALAFGVTNHSGILAHGFVPSGPQSC